MSKKLDESSRKPMCLLTGEVCPRENDENCYDCDINRSCERAKDWLKSTGVCPEVRYDTKERVYTARDKEGNKWESYDGEHWKHTKGKEAPVEAKSCNTRSYNVGSSDYSRHKIQPWDIWIEYKLNPFDADIIKRVLRHKSTDSRRMDYEKIIHICQERIRQIDNGEDVWEE